MWSLCKMRRYAAFAWKAGVYLRRSVVNIFDLLLWPITLTIPFGLLGKFMNQTEIIGILMIGAIGWVTTSAVQREIAVQFMIEVWQRTVKRNRTLPLSDFQYVTGNWLVGIIRGTVTFLLISSIAYFLFDFNIFSGDLRIVLLAIFGIFLMGLVIGTFVIGVVKILGHRADAIAWFITDVLIMFAGVYYSISLLPANIQIISRAIPLTYIFENLRQGTIYGATFSEVLPGFITMFSLLAVYIILVALFYNYAEKKAQKTGFYQRYD